MWLEQGANLPRVKVSNQCAILRIIYNRGPIRRSEIAKSLGLTLPTITTNVNNMIAAGIVRETGPAEPGGGYVGRRAQLVDIVPESRYFLGAEIKGMERTVCLLDYRGSLLAGRRDAADCRSYEDNITLTCGMIGQLLCEAKLSMDEIAGLGVCMPGLVNSERGILELRPSYGWRGRDVRSDMAQCTGYRGPISVGNNACARAFGAQLLQRDTVGKAETFAYMFVSEGIACPFVLNRSGSFGSVVGAGEVGHMVMEPDGAPCSCGNRGCLEAYSSDRAVRAACAEALAGGRAGLLRSLCRDGEPDMEQIIRAQTEGDRDVSEITARAVKTLGVAAANVSNFACPSLVMIEGELFRCEENRALFLDTVRRNICSVIRQDTQFVFVEPDRLSGAVGAAAMAICKDLETYIT